MDILDIDEALKDDSFIFLEDKTHDDVSNILQQWKTNNNFLPAQQQPTQLQQQNEQAFKLNSKTFTRPKRKLAQQQLEAHFANANRQQQQQNGAGNTAPAMLNLEIGGLVTNMHKSFLQDTSPPSSICSSMEMSLERMSNSLITSADFLHTSFLQSTNGYEPNSSDGSGARDLFNLLDKTTTCNGYSFSDMIRDRQALESLTASGDDTLIKDSQIAQIDEISLALSKTASGYSTMDNSTESVASSGGGGGALNRTVTRNERAYERAALQCNLADDMLIDTSMQLVENSMYESGRGQQSMLSITHCLNGATTAPSIASADETLKAPLTPASQHHSAEVRSAGNSAGNRTYDCQTITEERCETPENMKTLLYESTPRAAPLQSSQKSSKLADAMYDALSPIVAPTADPISRTCAPRALNETSDEPQTVLKRTFCVTPTLPACNDSMEMLETIENPNITYKKDYERSVADAMEMQSVMDLAQAEADLLADNDNEEEFEQMLDNFSRVSLKPEQLKMKRSLDTIKRRFISDKSQHAELYASATQAYVANSNTSASDEKHDWNANEMSCSPTQLEQQLARQSALADARETLRKSSGCAAMTNNGSIGSLKESPGESSAERLLSRRSRLYDEFSMSGSGSGGALGSPSQLSNNASSASFVVCKHNGGEQLVPPNEKTEPEAAMYKLAEKRERDRDRFKTIKIIKPRMAVTDGANAHSMELNVPCIDDDYDEGGSDPTSRLSRRDSPPKDVAEPPPSSQPTNKLTAPTNYLTYKKPKERSILQAVELPAIEPPPAENAKPRSLSRPRFLSGLQKFGAVSKAISAGDLEQSSAPGASKYGSRTYRVPGVLEQQLPPPPKLKSPMGIKSKSFHNLSSNMIAAGVGTGNGGSGLMAPRASGLRKYNSGGLTTAADKPKVTYSARAAAPSNTSAQTKVENSTVFKIPKSVSGLRAPSSIGPGGAAAAAGKRNSVVRPSSGYYSLNVNAKAPTLTAQRDADNGDRYSTSDSLSSTASRTSQQSVGGFAATAAPLVPGDCESTLATAAVVTAAQQPECNGLALKVAPPTVTVTLTKFTTGATGIPKPSGLKPPSNIKRSALPRPASVVRR